MGSSHHFFRMRMKCQSSVKMLSLDMFLLYTSSVQLPQFLVHADLENRHWWFLGRRSIFRTLLHHVCPPGQWAVRTGLPGKAKLLLDVGCGTGGNTAEFSKDYHCIGIETVAEAVKFARDRFPSVEFHKGFAPEDCMELMAKADIVLLADVLEHIEDDFLLVSKVLGAMKPSAHLLLIAPADPGLWSAHDRGFEHYRRYTTQRLRMLWEGLPVEERVVSYCNSRLYPVAKLARAVARFKGSALGPNETDLSLPPSFLNTLFTKIFAGERKRLLRVAQGRGSPYRHGVSVIAMLRRGEGEIAPRGWPEGMAKDARPWMS